MNKEMLRVLEKGKVYFPMSKIKRENNRLEAFILFEATEKQWIILSPKVLKQAVAEGYDIRGFLNNSAQPNSYFRKMRVCQDDGSEAQWLLYEKEIIGRQTVYHLVSEDNVEQKMTRGELTDLINNGTVVLGVKKLGDRVLISQEIFTQINKAKHQIV